MGDTSVRLSEEAKTRLELTKREGESFDDVILRLTSGDKWAGFGVLADEGSSTREGMNRIREEMSSGIEADIEEMGHGER